MAGYQEFKAGSVWFYYNPYASKELERTKELGIITCRPVVVVQSAYYQEWTENITVCPITSSDRRSGVHIDTTVLSNGGIIEGGTILPYLIYTVKTRYLHPITVSGRQEFLSLLALTDEDREKVMQGVAYHLGFTKVEPDYVTHWKKLDEYGRNVMTRSIRLAITEFETHTRLLHHISQVRDDSDYVENHVNYTMNRMNPERTEFIDSRPDLKPSATPIVFNRYYLEDEPDQIKFLEAIDEFGFTAEFFRDEPVIDCFYEGSTKLQDVSSSKVTSALTPWEMRAFLELKGKEMMTMTGIKSSSTAYRTKRAIETYLQENPKALSFGIHSFGQGKRDNNEIFITRSKTNLVRWKFILERTPEELQWIMDCQNELEFQNRYPSKVKLKLARTKEFIVALHPEFATETVESTIQNTPDASNPPPVNSFYDDIIGRVDRSRHSPKLEFWKTLSPQEMAEIASCSKRNSGQTCKKFRLSKMVLKSIKTQCSTALRDKRLTEIRMDDIDKAGFSKILNGNFKVDTTTLYLFCIANYGQIMEVSNQMGSDKCPSRQAIASAKARIRSIICVKPT